MVGTPNRSSTKRAGSSVRRNAPLPMSCCKRRAGLAADALDDRVGFGMDGRRIEHVVAVQRCAGSPRTARTSCRRGAARRAGCARDVNGPCCVAVGDDVRRAAAALRPEMRASSGADAVFTSAPTALTQSSTIAVERARQLALARRRAGTGRRRSTSARSSRARPADPAGGGRSTPRRGASRRDRGTPSRRSSDAEYTEAPASDTTIRVSASSGCCADQLGHELLGLARRRAVADRDEIHLVRHAQRRERRDRAVPSRCAARADRPCVVASTLPGGVDDGDLHARADARVEPHRRARRRRARRAAGRAGCVPNTRMASASATSRSRCLERRSRAWAAELDLPRQRHGVAQEASAGRPWCAMPATRRSGASGTDGAPRRRRDRRRRASARGGARPRLRPRSSARARCDGSVAIGSLASK